MKNCKDGIVRITSAGSSALTFPIPGADPVISQLRPDQPVYLDRRDTWHYHGDDPKPGEWPVYPPEAGVRRAGKKLVPVKSVRSDAKVGYVISAELAESHINRSKRDDAAAPYDPSTGMGAHKGLNLNIVHRHAAAKAKYVLLGPDKRMHKCKRIDLHPLAAQRIATARRILFVLEGTPKNDAVVSAGEAVFSVPSVTLWDPQELRRWISFIERRNPSATIFVVPDADWIDNLDVDRQALLVRSCIRRAGMPAYIAAPPVQVGLSQCKCEPVGRTSNGRMCEDCGGYFKGVDDFLGAGGTVDDLIVHGREAPVDRIDRWDAPHLRLDRLQGDRWALKGLSHHAKPDGHIDASVDTLARIMDFKKKPRAVQALEDLDGTIDIEGSLATKVEKWKYIDDDTGEIHVVPVLDWIERPTISVRPEYRAKETPDVRLGEFFIADWSAAA